MENGLSGSPRQKFAQNGIPSASAGKASNNHLNNISIQTGEEFSMDFIQDRAAPRGITPRPVIDTGQMDHVKYSNCPNFHAVYEDLTGILGLSRSNSDAYSDVSNSSLAKGNVGYLDRIRKVPSDGCWRITENCIDECVEYNNQYGSETSESPNSGKVKFLCSFGGKILPRPGDGRLRYVGGDNRLISIGKQFSWRELMQKTLKVYSQPHTIKYQLPGEDLDALISVSCNEDLQNMMEEYNNLERADGSFRLRIFLISPSETESPPLDTRVLQSDSEYHYFVAVNNIAEPSAMKISSGNNSLSSQIGYILDNNSPSIQNNSQFSPLDITSGTKDSAGMCINRPSPQLFDASQIVRIPMESSPFTPTVNQKGSAKISQKQSAEDQYVIYQQKIQSDIQMPNGSSNLPFVHHAQIRELVNPHFTHNQSDLSSNSNYEKSAQEERSFHSEKCRIKESVGPVQGMPHACSDSLLQDPSERVVPNISEFAESYLNFMGQPSSHNTLIVQQQELDLQCQENALNVIYNPYTSQKTISENFQNREEPSISHLVSETSTFTGNLVDMNCNPYSVHGGHVSSKESEAFECSVPTFHLNSSKESQAEKPAINTGFVCEDTSTMPFVPPSSWPMNYLETSCPNTAAPTCAVPSNSKSTEDGIANSSSSVPLVTLSSTDMSLNLYSNGLPTWSLFNSAAMDDVLKREVALLHPDAAKCSYSGANPAYHGVFLEKSRTNDVPNVNAEAPIETVVTVEDVTDSVPPDIPASSVVVPHVFHECAEDDENGNTSSPECRSEDGKNDERGADESISDAAIAEIEAGIYGLQIIRNADLEELRELGSGTFGTVFHGKWRGTDVAIKRIKKSCFAGRSSEQERLTKDFWREAQILSKLHHPNVVALYGVVPDGAEGTLATVTEYMVNGSLRHVLLRKDRALDRRKRLIIAMDAAFGMEYLHSKNIVHFDLKCDNLLVNLRDSLRPICKVGDFGLSRIKHNTMVSGGVRGTLPWMAPELLNGSSSRVSEKVDVFSFGIVLWEILTGEEPYANMHCGAIIGGIVSNTLRPPIPEKCDSEWRKLMEECWSADPAVRPSFTEITNRLRTMSMQLQPKGQTHQSNKLS
uniref:Protein kinase domain-containing protein n=1 Tax=Ananas comosus var. bracteatus TaxID=296719 RepID=A0A6V7NQW8_ANACO|nr:unnamed protein product [Ananas comosus var. bracteatus]